MTSISHQEESNLLFRAYQSGNSAALEELYRRWHEYVQRRVKQSNAFSQTDIEDISSNVWVLVQQHAQKWDVNRSSWYRFLNYRIRLAVSSESVRRERRRKILEDKGYDAFGNSQGMERVDSEPSALEVLIESERMEILEKAIRVCQFTPITERVLRLRLKGETLIEIQEALGLKQFSCVKLHLQRAFEDVKEVIDPVTFEVATVAPKVRRKRQRAESLRRSGEVLKKCLEQRSLTLMEVSRETKINLRDLTGFIKGKSRPEASRLHRLASFLGSHIYGIYTPALHNARWREQGQSLWRMRVKCGLSLRKASKLTGIHYSLLTQYEAGQLQIPPETESTLSNCYSKFSR